MGGRSERRRNRQMDDIRASRCSLSSSLRTVTQRRQDEIRRSGAEANEMNQVEVYVLPQVWPLPYPLNPKKSRVSLAPCSKPIMHKMPRFAITSFETSRMSLSSIPLSAPPANRTFLLLTRLSERKHQNYKARKMRFQADVGAFREGEGEEEGHD